jgi:hypothetical protein
MPGADLAQLLIRATKCSPFVMGSRLRDSLPRIDYLDSFEVPSRTPEHDVVLIYAAVFGRLPKVFKQPLVLRSRLVKPLGIAGVSYADLAQSTWACRYQQVALILVLREQGPTPYLVPTT